MSKKIILIIIAIAAVLAGGFLLWKQSSYSKEIIKLEILGPQNTGLGDEVQYVVKFKNNGNVRAESPELSFEFPKNSMLEEGKDRIQRMSSDQLGGDLYPGQERSYTFTGRLLGKEGDAETAKATLNFQPKGLSSRNEVSTTFTTVINKVSINFTLDFPSSEVSSGKNFTFKINYWSNVSYPLNDLTCKVQYPPSGFQFASAKPQALDQDQGNVWNIANLNEGEGGRVEVTGSVSGEAKEQKVFKAQIGIWREGEFIVLKEVYKGVEIAAPDLYISQKVNGSPQYVAVPGDLLHYEVSFRNMGEYPLTDLVLISRLDGSGLDLQSIRAPEGDFHSGDNSIIWDGKKISQLQYLDKGEEGKIEFWVKLKSSWPMQTLADKNPQVLNKITINQAGESFANKITSSLIGQGEISLDKYFTSSGSLPLEPDKSNTFAVVWKITNSYNKVGNVKIRATLPEGVNFTGEVWPPENSGITFDSVSREILWQVGDLEAGSGVLTDPKVCAFQLAVSPASQDSGRELLLLDTAQISGEDQWTRTTLSSEIGQLKARVK
ncbi:MAG: hypothetical protein WC397_04135 [Candidatus Paceibacterota bacterium]|jgi:hypothetical protein